MCRCDLLVPTLSFTQHRETCSVDVFVCDQQCGFSTKFRKELKKHEHLHHIGLFCEPCNKFFSTTTKLENHQLTVHKTKLSCDMCQQLFSSRGNLNSHKKLKHGSSQKLYKCSICQKTTLTASKLKLHEQTHEKQPNYLCSECGFTGKTMKEMKEHFKTHKTEKVVTEEVARKWFGGSTASNRGLLFLTKPLRYFQHDVV